MNKVEKFNLRLKKWGLAKTINFYKVNSIYGRMDKYISKPIAKLLWSKKALKDVIVLESQNDFDSNGGAFYDYLLKNGYNDKYEIVWMLANKAPKNLPKNVKCFRYSYPSFKKWYYLYTSKWLISGHVLFPSLREDQISLYTTHGSIIIKNVKGLINIPDEYTYILCASDWFRPIEEEQLSIKNNDNRIRIIGFPVDYYLFNSEPGDLKKITDTKYKKVILWTPTFRQNKDLNRYDAISSFSMGVPIIENEGQYEKLNNYLKENNIFLIIKIHPAQDLLRIKIKDMSNIKVLDSLSVKKLGVDNYRLMKDMDAMIGDYSSITAEFLHLNRPIAYCLDDVDDYKIGFSVDNPKEEFMAGDFIYSYEDLIKFIDNINNDIDPYKEKRELLRDKLFKYNDGKSCERMCSLLNIK